MMGILTIAVLLVFLLEGRLIVYTAFDRDFALTQKLPVRFIEYMMMFFIAATIVVSISLAGIMLLLSLLTVPQMTANMFTSDYKKITIISCILGFLCCITGLFLSYFLNIPSGAFIILILIVLFLISRVLVAIFKI
jgi:zinc transport system permease protein